jgi:Secretion system C-terminal sorting domain
MKQFTLLIFSLLLLFNARGQLYVNGDIYVQNNGLLYSQDTIQLANSANVVTNGIIQSTKGINTNGHLINTGTTGFIISPIASAVSKSFDIGTTTNNKLEIQHTTGSTTSFQMAVRDNVFTNPQTSATQITSKVVGKTWLVQPLSAATNCTAKLYWNVGDELTSFVRATSGISKWNTGATSWGTVIGGYTAAGTGTTPTYNQTATLGNLATNLSYLGVGSTGSSLPIHKLIFDAAAYKSDVLLNWKAIEAFNNKAFDLERSTDGNNFYKLITIANNATSQDYNYKDEKAFAVTSKEKLYYRLKQMDNDGKFAYSEIKRVFNSTKTTNTVSIYPNPAKDNFNIKIISENAVSNISITVYDELGKQVLYKSTSLIEGLQTIQINSSQLSKGIYNLIIATNDKIISTQKIIINN